MTETDIETIVEGRQPDPFSILGAHDSEIRAWLPQAQDAFVLTGNEAIPMVRVHPSGFFTAAIRSSADPYRLRVTWTWGQTVEIEDPYRFPPLLTPFELYLHGEGTNHESYRTLGAHPVMCAGIAGVRFAVWAPNAQVVSIVGDFNGWDRTRHPMRLLDGGIWEIFIPGLTQG